MEAPASAAEDTRPPVQDAYDAVQAAADSEELMEHIDVDYFSGSLPVDRLTAIHRTLWKLCCKSSAIRRPDEELKSAVQVPTSCFSLSVDKCLSGMRLPNDALRAARLHFRVVVRVQEKVL